MKRKVGFTLVELLAVIAILAILVIIALPNVMKMFNNAKKSAFETEVREIYINAKQQWMSDSLSVSSNQTYVKCKTEKCGKQLNMNTRNDLEYYIEMSGTGKVTSMYITDGTYQYKYEGTGLEKNDIGEAEIIAEIEDDIDKIAITCSGITEGKVIYVKPNPCTFNGDLVQGKEYTNGQYTYKYKQEYNGFSNSWNNMSNDGWGVKLTNLNSTENVNTKLCTSINDKPIVSMKFTFYNSKANNIDLSSFDTSNVTTFENMFYNCSNIKSLDLRTFNTSNVVNFQYMFSGDYNIEKLLIDNFDFSKISNMNYLSSMFSGMNKLKSISAKKWKIPNEFIDALGCRYTSLCSNSIDYIDVSNWDLSETKNIKGLFGHFYGKEIRGLNTWNTENVTNLYNLFGNATNLKEIDLSAFNVSKVTNMSEMFLNDNNLNKIIVDNWNLSGMTNIGVMGSMFKDAKNIKEVSMKNWIIPDNFTNMIGCRTTQLCSNKLETIDVSNWDISRAKNITGLFGDLKAKKIIGLNTWNTSNIENMSNIFGNCNNLEEIDLSSFDMRKVTNVGGFFYLANNIKKIITPSEYSNLDSIKIDLPNDFYDDSNNKFEKLEKKVGTKKVIKTLEPAIFDIGKNVNTKIKKLAGTDISVWKYEKYDENIKKIIRSNNAPNLNNMTEDNIISSPNSKIKIYAWFEGGTIYYYSDNKIVSLNSDASYMFARMTNLEKIDLNNIDASTANDISYMFDSSADKSNSIDISGISNWNVSNVTNMKYTFYYFASNVKTLNLNITGWNTSNVIDMNHMFYCTGYYSETLNMNLSQWDVSSVTNMSSMFEEIGYKSKNWYIGTLNNWDVSNVTNMSRMFMFSGHDTKNWNIGNLSNWNVSKVTDMNNLFCQAAVNSNSISLYLDNWNVSNVTNMGYMFSQFGKNAKTWSIGDLSRWNVSKVTNMGNLFESAGKSATNFNLGNLDYWNVSNVINMGWTFALAGQDATTWNIGKLNRWNVSNVTYMWGTFNHTGMNANVWGIGDLSNWDTSKVTIMNYMFDSAGKNAKTWNSIGSLIVNVYQMHDMFYNCPKAKATLNIYGAHSYIDAFRYAATESGSKIIVNYKNTVTDIDKIIKTKSSNSNVVRGSILR